MQISGISVKTLRKGKRFTQKEVAQALGISERHYKRIERGLNFIDDVTLKNAVRKLGQQQGQKVTSKLEKPHLPRELEKYVKRFNLSFKRCTSSTNQTHSTGKVKEVSDSLCDSCLHNILQGFECPIVEGLKGQKWVVSRCNCYDKDEYYKKGLTGEPPLRERFKLYVCCRCGSKGGIRNYKGHYLCSECLKWINQHFTFIGDWWHWRQKTVFTPDKEPHWFKRYKEEFDLPDDYLEETKTLEIKKAA